MKFSFFLLLLLSSFRPIFSEYTLGITLGKNFGEHIFETGNKYPNLSGIRGGSRITYDRNFETFGLNGGYYKNKWSFLGAIQGTGWNQKTGRGSRDEDFAMGSISTERGTKFSLYPLFLRDTAHTFTGTQNFADGHAKSTVNQIKSNFFARYYLNSSSSLWEKQNSVFFSFGFSYSYFKYYLYDVIQFVNRPFFYGPIGIGLSYSYSSIEIPFGVGYAYHIGKWKIEPSFFLLVGFSRYRDFHNQRALNFIGKGLGNGFIYNLQISYELSDRDLIKIDYQGHRFFGYTTFFTRGGLTRDDIISTFLGNYKSYVTTKETVLEFSYIRRFGFSQSPESKPAPEMNPTEAKENLN